MAENGVPDKPNDENFSNIFIAIIVILLTLVLFAIYRRARGSRQSILLTGLCDSGKTLIYSQLTQNKYVQTHTSIKENIGLIPINNAFLKIVDIPGHERLREKFFEQYKSSARGIVFVLDSLTIQQDVKDAAEFLYNIITDAVLSGNGTQVLVLCNKQDQALAKGSNAIKSMLEKELNMLRTTKASQLESVDQKVGKRATLGDTAKDFEFSASHLKIDFAESFAYSKNGSINFNDLRKWMAQI